MPLRGEGSCGGGGAPRDSAGSGATYSLAQDLRQKAEPLGLADLGVAELGKGRARDPRCSPRGNPACRGTFGGRRNPMGAWAATARAPVGSDTHSSTRGLRPPEQLERPAGFPSSARGEAKDSALLSSRDAGLLEPPERPQGSTGSLASQRHPGKFPKVPGRRRGTRGFPAAPRQRPRESFFNASRLPRANPRGRLRSPS